MQYVMAVSTPSFREETICAVHHTSERKLYVQYVMGVCTPYFREEAACAVHHREES